MIEGAYIDAVLTDDESDLMIIIDGLERQVQQLEDNLPRISKTAAIFGACAVTFLGIGLTESRGAEKLESLAVTAALSIGGLERLIRHRTAINGIRRKNRLAIKLKHELDDTDLERFEERYFEYYQDEDRYEDY